MKLKPQGRMGCVTRAPLFGMHVRHGARAVATARRHRGFQLIECLVYIAVLLILLGVIYAAFYRFTTNSITLRRNVEDITKTLRVGELWRADLRSATGDVRVKAEPNGSVLLIPGAQGGIAYQSTTNAVRRRVGSGSWSVLLDRVKSSSMVSDRRPDVTAWRWELELQPRAKKPGRVRPLFTFIGVPKQKSSP